MLKRRELQGSGGIRRLLLMKTGQNLTLLVENGGRISLSGIGHSFPTAKNGLHEKKRCKLTEKDFLHKKSLFLKEISSLVHAHNIPSGLILNWDQTGFCFVPSGDHTLEQQGATRVENACFGDKRQVTATFSVSMSGKCKTGHMLGPFLGAPIPGMHFSSSGVIPKHHQPGKWRLILDLSNTQGHSVNDGIDPRLCSLQYISVDG